MEKEAAILQEQEQVLQFERFNHEVAWELGSFMISYAQKNNITIAVSIRMNSGCIVFQHCPDGTNLLNQKWMERKFNTVKLMERSSLLSTLAWEANGCDAKVHGLQPDDYAICGGGFPIRVSGTSTPIGAVIASNLYHISDHEFVIDCLREFLNKPEAPKFPYTIP